MGTYPNRLNLAYSSMYRYCSRRSHLEYFRTRSQIPKFRNLNFLNPKDVNER